MLTLVLDATAAQPAQLVAGPVAAPSPAHGPVQGRFRIRDGVRPYAGRILAVDLRDGFSLGGFVQLGGGRVATARRWYGLHELMPVSDEAIQLAASMDDEAAAAGRPNPNASAGEGYPLPQH